MHIAGMAKLVDAPALGADGVTHGGSSPLPGTIQNNSQKVLYLQRIFTMRIY